MQDPNPLRVRREGGCCLHAAGQPDRGLTSLPGNPYDGHTLYEQLEQATILMQNSAVKPATAFVDLGYGGLDAQNPDVHIVHRG